MNSGNVRLNISWYTEAIFALEYLDDIINQYILAYTYTYETLFDSLLTRRLISDTNFALLRHASMQQMRIDADNFYEDIRRNANSFNRLYTEIGQAMTAVRNMRRRPTAGHAMFFRHVIERTDFHRDAIMALTNRMNGIRDRVVEREGQYGMMSVYHPRRYVPLLDHWFPENDNQQTVIVNWFRVAHHRLLHNIDTELRTLENLTENVSTKYNNINEFINEFYETLLSFVPNFSELHEFIQEFGNRIDQLKDHVRNFREVHSSNELNEATWRNLLLQVKEYIENILPKLLQKLDEIVDDLDECKEAYENDPGSVTRERHEQQQLDKLCEQFENLFPLQK